MKPTLFEEHPLPWRRDGVHLLDARARQIGSLQNSHLADAVVSAMNATPAPELLPLAGEPLTPELLVQRLTPADAESLAGKLVHAHRLIVVPEVSKLVLDAMKDVPERALHREQIRDDWRANVAGAELTRRLDEFARTRNKG